MINKGFKTGLFLLLLINIGCFAQKGNQQKKEAVVALDYYFNSEWKKDKEGNNYRFHYTWEDREDSGFSMWDSAFAGLNAKTISLETAPTKGNLSEADIYIIVDPDTQKETAMPNFIKSADVKVISDWVKAGGVLVLMANDSSNAELDNFNKLAAEFGIKFNKDLKNPVTGKQYEMGKIMIPSGHFIFNDVKKIYIKEFSSLNIQKPAKAALTHKDDVVMAYAKVGKGTVFAVGDPWLYNEYSNKSRLSEDYENYKAGKALAGWLIKQTKGGK